MKGGGRRSGGARNKHWIKIRTKLLENVKNFAIDQLDNEVFSKGRFRRRSSSSLFVEILSASAFLILSMYRQSLVKNLILKASSKQLSI